MKSSTYSRRPSVCGWLAAATSSLVLTATTAARASEPEFERWGHEALEVIERDLWIPEQRLYAEENEFSSDRRRAPAFMWSVGVQLTALAAAAELDPGRYLERLTAYVDRIDAYWLEHDGIHGYDVLPGPKSSDRYYDDNAWIILALAEIFEITEDPAHLERAIETYRFVMSGEDEKLGGGLYWRERELTSKNTCTNAPTIVSALRLYQLTGKEAFLADARRIHRWTTESLQDDDGLFWDHIKMDGSIGKRKFTYNSALMIRANTLFHAITKESEYLDEAHRIAQAAIDHWVMNGGRVDGQGRFVHLLIDAWLELHDHQPDEGEKWLEVSSRCMVFVRHHVQDQNGRYPKHWNRKTSGALPKVALLDQASAARAFLALAKRRP